MSGSKMHACNILFMHGIKRAYTISFNSYWKCIESYIYSSNKSHQKTSQLWMGKPIQWLPSNTKHRKYFIHISKRIELYSYKYKWITFIFFSPHFQYFILFYCVHNPTSSYYGKKKKLSSQLFQISMTIHVWIVQMIKFVDLFDSPFSRAFHFAFANFVFCPSFLPSSHLLFDVKTNYYWSQFYDINKIIFNWMMIWNRNGNQNCTCSGEINPIYTFDVKEKWKKLHNCWHKSNENQQHKLNSTHSNGWNG